MREDLAKVGRQNRQKGKKRDACLSEGGQKNIEPEHREPGDPRGGPRTRHDQSDHMGSEVVKKHRAEKDRVEMEDVPQGEFAGNYAVQQKGKGD